MNTNEKATTTIASTLIAAGFFILVLGIVKCTSQARERAIETVVVRLACENVGLLPPAKNDKEEVAREIVKALCVITNGSKDAGAE